VSLSLASAPLLAASVNGKAWQDPLDTPSVQSPLAASTQLLSVAKAGKRLVVVGWRGHILISDDDGQHWHQSRSPVSVDLTMVDFTSDRRGWAVGHGGVLLRTDDAGASWTVVLDGRSSSKPIRTHYSELLAADMQAVRGQVQAALDAFGTNGEQPWLGVRFLDKDNGWVFGPFGLLMETRNGGETWTPVIELVDNPDGLHLTGMTFIDGAVFIASEQGIVFRRRSGEKRFTALRTGYAGTYFGVLGVQRDLYAYGLRGTIYRSKDAGGTWQKVQSDSTQSITGGTSLPDGRVVFTTQAGEILLALPEDDRLSRISGARSFPLAGLVATESGAILTVGQGGTAITSVPARRSVP